MLDRLIQEHAARIVDVAARHGAETVRVFGSRSTGSAKPRSDVDLLVKLGPGGDLLDLVGIKQDLEAMLGVAVDVVEEAGLSPYMKDRVLAEAVAL